MSSIRWPRRARLLSVLGYVGSCGLCVCFLWAGASIIINSLIGHDNRTDVKHRGSPPSYHNMLEKTITAASLADPMYFREIFKNILVPRVVGTPSHTKVREYIIEQLSSHGWSVTTDVFSDKTPNFGHLTFSNIIARLNPAAKEYIVLSCHYDSKYFPNMVFLGATDSAAPCAMLIDLAKTLQKELTALKNTDISLELWFFDGEEAFVEWGPLDSIYGARHLAMKMEQEQTLSKIKCLILLDLLGSKNPVMYNYYNEQEVYKHLVASEKALRSGGYLTAHRTLFRTDSVHHLVEDDHIPFLQRNVPVVHWIPRRFPDVWHTSEDNESAIDWSSLEDMNKILRLFILRYFNL